MGNIVVLGILTAVIGAAVAYIVKAKKSGVKCIGCSASSGCACGNATENSYGCGCGCGGCGNANN